jgi:hypothetical protein
MVLLFAIANPMDRVFEAVSTPKFVNNISYQEFLIPLCQKAE